MIELRNLSVRAGAFGLQDVSFEIPAGQYGVLMGRTGSGKTTILEAVCGLKTVTGGRIFLHGRDVTGLPAGQRGIGFVPQDGILFSTRTVAGHLAFGPRLQRWPKSEIASRVEELAEELGIAHLLRRTPHGLSGGERQRVALGRALAARPRVLCLDEPLSALDEETHREMIALIKRIVHEHQMTALHITHSPREAELVADRIVRLEKGQVHIVGEKSAKPN